MDTRRTQDTLTTVTLAILALIVVFGFTLRYQAFVRSEVPLHPHGDAARYFLYAYNLKNFGVYSQSGLRLLPAATDRATAHKILQPDATITPGYPLYLSLFLGGQYTKSQSDNARFGQVLLSSLTILLAYAAFAPLGRLYGLGIAALTALSPHLINMNLFLLTETLFCFFLMGFVLLISRVKRTSPPALFIALGLLLAVATLVRPWLLAYLFVLLGYLFCFRVQFSLRPLLYVLLGAALALTPWLVRNSIMLDGAADSSQLTRSIQHGMYPDMMYEDDPDSLGIAYKSDPMSSKLGESLGATLAEIGRRAQAEPYKYAKWYLVGKIQSVLSWKIIAGADAIFVYEVKSSPYFELPRFYLSAYYMERIHGFLMALALLGTLLVWLPRALQGLSVERAFFIRAISLLIIYFLLMHMVVAPYPRYAIPLRPLLYAMALYPLVFAFRIGRERFEQRRARQRSNPVAG